MPFGSSNERLPTEVVVNIALHLYGDPRPTYNPYLGGYPGSGAHALVQYLSTFSKACRRALVPLIGGRYTVLLDTTETSKELVRSGLAEHLKRLEMADAEGMSVAHAFAGMPSYKSLIELVLLLGKECLTQWQAIPSFVTPKLFANQSKLKNLHIAVSDIGSPLDLHIVKSLVKSIPALESLNVSVFPPEKNTFAPLALGEKIDCKTLRTLHFGTSISNGVEEHSVLCTLTEATIKRLESVNIVDPEPRAHEHAFDNLTSLTLSSTQVSFSATTQQLGSLARAAPRLTSLFFVKPAWNDVQTPVEVVLRHLPASLQRFEIEVHMKIVERLGQQVDLVALRDHLATTELSELTFRNSTLWDNSEVSERVMQLEDYHHFRHNIRTTLSSEHVDVIFVD